MSDPGNPAGSRPAPALILPPGVRSAPAEAVHAALLTPPQYPRLQRIEGAPHQFPAGRGIVLRFYVQTSPATGRTLTFGVPFGALLPQLAALLRDTAAALDEIASHGPDPDPADTQAPRPAQEAPTTAPTGSTGNPTA